MDDRTLTSEGDMDADAVDYSLSRRDVSAILFAVDREDREALLTLFEDMHPADIADLLEQIGLYDRRRLILLYDRDFDGDVLSELDDTLREEVISYLKPEVLAEAVRDLDSDDVVDLLEDLEEEQQTQILDALDDSDRVAVEQALQFPEYSAGRLMQREVVKAPEHWTVGQAIDFMRRQQGLPDQFYHIVLVDPRMRPIGNVTLGRLMSSKRDVALMDLKETVFEVFPATQDEGDVAYAFNQYHLISAPVVDEEHEEDILRLAGVGESSLSDSVIETTKQRLPWLAVNLFTAILASLVIAIFEDTIATFVALAVLMPIVASMGGNAGTQSLTVAVRAIATKDLTGSNVWRVITREISVGVINGLIFAVVMGIIGVIWFGSPALGYVIALAMIINMIVAGLAGTAIPVILEKLGIDPALASGAFVTTVTDVVGFFAFLTLAGVLLL